MKRQHPENPGLFWCPKCREYKQRLEFHRSKNDLNGIASPCIACRCQKTGLPYRYSKEGREKMALTQIKKGERRSPGTEFKKGERSKGRCFKKGDIAWNDAQMKVLCDWCGEKFKIKPYQFRKSTKNHCSKPCADKSLYSGGKAEQQRIMRESCVNLDDRYIKAILGNAGMKPEEKTPLTIELKRQQMAMKRTLRQFKKWRKNHEHTNCRDVQEEQCQDEQNHEGRISA